MSAKRLMLLSLTSPVFASSTWCLGGDMGVLEFSVSLRQRIIAEGAPLLASLSLKNVSDQDVRMRYNAKESQLMGAEATLLLAGKSGVVWTIRYERVGAPPTACGPARGPTYVLQPGETISTDHVMCLVYRRKNERRQYVWEILGPGRYMGHFELKPGNAILKSNVFDIIVEEPNNRDREVRTILGFEHLNFFEGRDSPSSYARFLKGQAPVDGTTHKRFEEIEGIARNFPDSTYAEWIRFWKLYHHGPIEDALEYARAHPDFPLSDNLMLHIAEGLFGKEEYVRAREVLSEVSRLFPTGDTRAGVARLERRLEPKFPAKPVRKN